MEMTIRKLGILGASGRMGRTVDELTRSVFSERAQVTAAVDMRQGALDDFASADAVIDFSLPAGTAALVKWMEAREGSLHGLKVDIQALGI